jgi:hypothetical protein
VTAPENLNGPKLPREPSKDRLGCPAFVAELGSNEKLLRAAGIKLELRQTDSALLKKAGTAAATGAGDEPAVGRTDRDGPPGGSIS